MKDRRKAKKRPNKLWIVILSVVLTILVIIAVVLVARRAGDNSTPDTNMKDSRKSTDTFDDGKLKLVGSMEYKGPDYEDGSMKDGTYTILEIQNISESFLRSASIEVKVNDTDKMLLTIDSLPAGETVYVIGQEYDMYSEQDIYEVISCESFYEESAVCEKEGLEISCEAGKIQIVNQTAEDLSGVMFRYKGKVDDTLLGGITYEFVADSLPVGGTFEIESQSLLADSVQIVEIK